MPHRWWSTPGTATTLLRLSAPSGISRLVQATANKTLPLFSPPPQCTRYGRRSTSSVNSTTLDTDRYDMTKYTPDKIRNFSVIAHIDHGKSTLADRLLELTGTIDKNSGNKQVLDKLKVERERGITVKAQTVTMFWKDYLINLIDTPGHVDFSYEVSRSLAACQGTLLLVDATQGIQAQTVANFYLAFGQNIEVIPVINKIDLSSANPESVADQIYTAFELDTQDIIKISAKTGVNVEQLIPAVVKKVPPPSGDINKPPKALLFDQWYDKYLGVVCMIAMVDGIITKGDRLTSAHSGTKYDVSDIGILNPERVSTGSLQAGQVGFVILNMKTAAEAHIGDTFYHHKQPVEPLPGFEAAKSMVFAGVYPVDGNEFRRLEDSVSRLTLNDASVGVQRESSNALGQGFRLGFLGTLHMNVFQQRLFEEYDSNVIITQPTVPYKVVYVDGTSKIISNPAEFPDLSDHRVTHVQEPMVLATIIFPEKYMGGLIEMFGNHRGEQVEYTYLDGERYMLKYRFPMAEIVSGFYDQLKSKSSGFATFDYEEVGYETSNLSKMTILLNGKPVDALCCVLHKSQVELQGRDWVKRLKEVIRKQLFEIVIQAVVGSRVIARESIPAMRKNVTSKCYGGDVSRKMKLLAAQKAGKERMKVIGNVELTQEAFLTFLRNDK